MCAKLSMYMRLKEDIRVENFDAILEFASELEQS